MICCLNPHCSQENPPCPDGMKFCSSCGTELILLSDRYRPTKRLGEGGFAITYLAEDNERFSKPCVIKQLTLQIPEARRLFEGEARRLEELADYPAIPRLLSYRSDTNYLYLVQEFVEGQDFGKELRQKGAFDEKRVRDFLQAVLPILEVIHAKGIIHRDIKLDNIILGADGKIVLIDFGIAKVIPANNTPKPGTQAGTEGYAAPEQMKEGKVSPASDLYSLGAACFHLLTNISPGTMFMDYGYRWTAGWQRHLKNAVSKELELIIDLLLKTEYKDRYQSADIVLKALNKPLTTPIKSPSQNSQFNLLNSPDPSKQKTPSTKAILKNNFSNYFSKYPPAVFLYGAYVILIIIFVGIKIFGEVNQCKGSPEFGALDKYIDAGECKNRGVSQFHSGDVKGSIEDYERALARNSNYADVYSDRGLARYNLGDKKCAIEDYNKSIDLKPDNPYPHLNRGVYKEQSGDVQGAIQDYLRAIKLKPDFSDAYRNRGISLERFGDKESAIKDYKKAALLYKKQGKDKDYEDAMKRIKNST
jgi:serine/threonine protein kinase